MIDRGMDEDIFQSAIDKFNDRTTQLLAFYLLMLDESMVGFRPKTSQYSGFPNISYKPRVSQLILEQCFVVLYNKCCVAGMFTYIFILYINTHTHTHTLCTPFHSCGHFLQLLSLVQCLCRLLHYCCDFFYCRMSVGDMTDADDVKALWQQMKFEQRKINAKTEKSKNTGRRH
jgi:hypothetical protein